VTILNRKNMMRSLIQKKAGNMTSMMTILLKMRKQKTGVMKMKKTMDQKAKLMRRMKKILSTMKAARIT
jgi:hypothetical protein